MNKAEQLIACLEGEIAKRDAIIYAERIDADLQRQELDAANGNLAGMRAELSAAKETISRYETTAENCDLLRAELAAIKAQVPAFMWHKGATEDESEVVDVDCACPCCVPLYAAPVSEAKAQGVVIPEAEDFCFCGKHVSLQMISGGASNHGYLGYVTLLIDGKYVEYTRLNAAPVQRPKCKTCDDNGRIGGPSFYAPDEGGDPCPDCCAHVQQVSVPDGFVLAKETIVEMPDGSKELGHTTIGRVGIFNSAEEVFDAIRELDLPLGWVSMTTEQLLPGWMLAAATAAPAAPAADEGMVEALGYQVLFDAIAAATSVYANGAVNISVQAFRESLAAHRAKWVV